MEVNEILDAIRHNKGRFAREAALAAIEKREEITPHLLGILEDTIRDAHRLAEEPAFMAHMYAIHLLAEFRERRAYPLVARLFSIPGEVVDQLWGDFLTEGLGLVLATVAHGDPGLIQQLIENREAFLWARADALRAIPAMVGAQELSREAALAYFRELLRGKLEREPLEEVGDIWSSLVNYAIDLHAEEIYEDIEMACRRKLVSPGFIALEDVDSRLDRDRDEVLRALPKKHPLITDAIAEMHWWACFEDDYKERQKERKKHRPPPPLPARRREPSPSPAGSAFRWDRRDGNQEPAVQTILRDGPKVGRNDPCTCGSGRKYKKCCGIKEHA